MVYNKQITPLQYKTHATNKNKKNIQRALRRSQKEHGA